MSDLVAAQPHRSPANDQPTAPGRRPPWIKVKLRTGDNYKFLKDLVGGRQLHTVCQEARCPNIYECWERRTATLMILGEVCTRSCGFCAVTTGRPAAIDSGEPRRVAEAVRMMGLGHCVITSVDRDELPDGGAALWAETIRQVRRQAPDCTLEVLVPDFGGDEISLQKVIDAEPDIFGHNLETVPRLYRRVRPQADYRRSLEVLAFAAGHGLAVKSGIMVGLGESGAEVQDLMTAAAASGCRLFTVGQYLQPTREHLAVARYVPPVEFGRYREFGLQLGLAVEAGPLVRSSYHAERLAQSLGLLSSGRGNGYAGSP